MRSPAGRSGGPAAGGPATTVRRCPVKVGFTGTRQGMTHPQRVMVEALLTALACDEFHHGDCDGADSEAHDIAAHGLLLAVVVHPPSDSRLRAHRAPPMGTGGRVCPPKPYHDRNRDIVDETEVLVAAPAEAIEQSKGGTWWTVRYALSVGRTVYIVAPSGLPERRDS